VFEGFRGRVGMLFFFLILFLVGFRVLCLALTSRLSKSAAGAAKNCGTFNVTN
jgi:hypothetical protein